MYTQENRQDLLEVAVEFVAQKLRKEGFDSKHAVKLSVNEYLFQDEGVQTLTDQEFEDVLFNARKRAI